MSAMGATGYSVYKLLHKITCACRITRKKPEDNATNRSETTATEQVAKPQKTSWFSHHKTRIAPMVVVTGTSAAAPAVTSTQHAQLFAIANTTAAKAYTQPVAASDTNPSARTYLEWAARWEAAADSASNDTTKIQNTERAIDSAKYATILGIDGGIKKLCKIHETHDVSKINLETTVVREEDRHHKDSRLALTPGTNDLSFWKNVEKNLSAISSQLTYFSGSNVKYYQQLSSPSGTTYFTTRVERAARFIAISRQIIDPEQALGKEFANEWNKMFNDALVKGSVFPSYDSLVAKYNAHVPQATNMVL